MNKADISVKDCNLWYGDFRALKDISIEIPANEITALIGPSGCGKSTFLKIFNRMNDLVPGCRITGNFTVGGNDIFAKNCDVTLLRKNVGMVFQKPNPFPMSIYENIAFAPKTFGVKKKSEIDEIVECSLVRAGIWDEVKDRLRKSALGMSGGQQQRLCIARALAVKPKMMLFDEPTSALDPELRHEVLKVMQDLAEEGMTMVIVTHEIGFAEKVASRLIFIDKGRIAEDGDPQVLIKNPPSQRLQEFLQHVS